MIVEQLAELAHQSRQTKAYHREIRQFCGIKRAPYSLAIARAFMLERFTTSLDKGKISHR